LLLLNVMPGDRYRRTTATACDNNAWWDKLLMIFKTRLLLSDKNQQQGRVLNEDNILVLLQAA
jgi:hypothetical protein